jgi:hypothetical protein
VLGATDNPAALMGIILEVGKRMQVVRAIEIFKGRCIEMRSHVSISKK